MLRLCTLIKYCTKEFLLPLTTLWETISVESKEEIRQHEEYLEADLTLWSIIVETQVTAIHRAGPAMRELEIVTLKSKLNTMRQKPNMTIGEFKKDFDDHLEVMTGAGVELVPQSELAMMFLTKPDRTRYVQMMVQLTNDATLGRPFPQTLHAAWTIMEGSDRESATRVRDALSVHSSGRGPQRGWTWERTWTGHRKRKIGGKAWKERTSSREADQHSGDKDLQRVLAERTLAICPDNPSNLQSAMVTTDDTDSIDYDAHYDTAFVCTTKMKEVVLFTKSDIILDNGASRSVFCNESLITKVEQETPFYIGGIDSSSKGLLVTKRGQFDDYGHVAFHPQAAVYVISVAEALNRGCTVVYSSPRDMYTFGVGVHQYVFSRKTVDGNKSSHYTCGTTTHTALMTTVADNMRNYTPREVLQARAARELMVSLAHNSSAAIIDILDSGILSCSVTKTDVRNADAVFGPSIPSLEGKTAKLPSTIRPNILAPRVSQVKQIMTVDIFFVKKIPFLLGVFIPLRLSMCVHLKNRGTECVASGLTSFLATASGRGFDCVINKTDGEGAVGAKLNSKGIVVDTSGPGQHGQPSSSA